MPEPKRPLKVFLSYASQDKSLVRELSRRLVGEGWIDTWQDEKNLLPGQDWRVKIEEAVEEADVVIIVLSQHSVSKEGHVQKELRYAREIALEKPEDTIFLIPLRLDECEVPRGLRFYQWVDYFGERKNDGYASLVESLQLRYEQKLKQEEEAFTRQEKIRKEREAAEKIFHEKAEQEAAERARLEASELAKQKVARERAEREATRKRAEKEAAEKVRLDEEKQARQKAAEEKVEREAAEKAAREKAEKEAAEEFAREKAEREEAEKTARDKAEKEAAEKANLKAEELAGQKTSKEKAGVEFSEKAKSDNATLKPVKEKFAQKNNRTELGESENQNLKPSSKSQTIFWIFGIIATVAVVISLSSLNSRNSPTVSAPTNTQSVPVYVEPSQPVVVPRATNTLQYILTSTEVNASETPNVSTEITDFNGDQMVLVSAGNFIMGSDNGDANEKPAHTVYIDSYYIDKYEVTNAHYKVCVDAGLCPSPQTTKWNGDYGFEYFGVSGYGDLPIVYVDWSMATAYCKWRNARLPTEAEWEKAARGIDGDGYPWGDVIDRTLAHYGVSSPAPGSPANGTYFPINVGSYESGKSPYGAYDMAGNVWEWVADWYGQNYYATLGNDAVNPNGPENGVYRVLKGGSFSSSDYFARSAVRLNRGSGFAWVDIGFRCARSANP